jgi:hypothetical protein
MALSGDAGMPQHAAGFKSTAYDRPPVPMPHRGFGWMYSGCRMPENGSSFRPDLTVSAVLCGHRDDRGR